MYAALRAEGPHGIAQTAIDDTLAYVPFRKLPPWLKRRQLLTTVRDTAQGWWLRAADVVGDAGQTLCGRRRT